MRKWRRAGVFIALIWLIGLHLAVADAGFISPYDPARQNRSLPFTPPTRFRFGDPKGPLYWHTFVCQVVGQNPSGLNNYREDCARRYPVHLFVSGFPYRIGPFECTRHLFGVDEPAEIHAMGTDQFGRDQFSRFLYGGRVSLLAGLLACAASLGLGAALGITAGFSGRYADEAIMWAAELMLSLPWLYALIAVRAFLPHDMEPSAAFLVIIALVGIMGWARPARLIRGIAISAREREYVKAARGFGASAGYIMRRHILPQTSGVFLTLATLLIPRYVLAEATLSFFGLGVNEPAASWGNLLSPLQQYNVLTSYWWMFLPAFGIIATTTGWLTVSYAIETGD
jgi:peptide/nickel transport system permease protein